MNYSLLFGIEVTVNHIEIYLPLVVCVAWHGTDVVLVCGFLHFCREKGEKTGKKSLFCRVSSLFERSKKIEIKQQPESRFEDKKKGKKSASYIHIILCVLVLSFR